MKSLEQLYKIGVGPSSSHTMGPARIATEILSRHPNAERYEVTLYGSLSATGRGHGTDAVLRQILGERISISFDRSRKELPHPNTITLRVLDEGFVSDYEAYSIGGGDIQFRGETRHSSPDVYPQKSFLEIMEYCKKHKKRLSDYVLDHEDICDYLTAVWAQMKYCIQEGLNTEGELPGGLKIMRKAKHLMEKNSVGEFPEMRQNRIVCATAFAVAEQNASYATVVTAPTCGSAGVVPAVLYYMQKQHSFSDISVARALAAGGVIGNLIKENASISGAECGCQAEIGSACAMAAAALSELFEMDIEQLECAAEIAMEHHLGLTCDPVHGLVQIPCIERNGVAAMRAINAVSLSEFLADSHKIKLDTIIDVMYKTGKDMPKGYRETSEAGLASAFRV